MPKVQVYEGKPDYALEAVNETIPEFLPRLHFYMTMVAMRGSGKSNLLLNFILNNDEFYPMDTFEDIYVFSPTFYGEANDKWSLTKGIIPEENVFTEYDDATFKEFTELLDTDKRNLLIFDDMGSFAPHGTSAFSRFVIRHRHHQCSVIQVCHYYKQIPKSLRGNMTDLVLFKMPNYNEVSDIAHNLGMGDQELIEVLPTEPYEFRHFDIRNNRIDNNFEVENPIRNKIIPDGKLPHHGESRTPADLPHPLAGQGSVLTKRDRLLYPAERQLQVPKRQRGSGGRQYSV